VQVVRMMINERILDDNNEATRSGNHIAAEGTDALDARIELEIGSREDSLGRHLPGLLVLDFWEAYHVLLYMQSNTGDPWRWEGPNCTGWACCRALDMPEAACVFESS